MIRVLYFSTMIKCKKMQPEKWYFKIIFWIKKYLVGLKGKDGGHFLSLNTDKDGCIAEIHEQKYGYNFPG